LPLVHADKRVQLHWNPIWQAWDSGNGYFVCLHSNNGWRLA